MLVQKFARLPSEVTQLDNVDKDKDVQDLASLPGAKTIVAQDFGMEKNGNPDAASGQGKMKPVVKVPGLPQ